MKQYSEVEKLVFAMLKENTGIAMMDSGGDSGRQWQRNAKKSIDDFANAPAVEYDVDEYIYTLTKDGEFKRRAKTENELLEYLQRNVSYSWEHAMKYEGWKIEKAELKSDDISLTVSLFHYLPTVLELDDLCREFNALPVEDWEADIYGVSTAGKQWIESHGLKVGDSWNTYNGEDLLSQTLQGTNLHVEGNESHFEYPDYVLLQVHGGADVRGGYTDAKLFKLADDAYINSTPTIYGSIDGVDVSTLYDGHTLYEDDGNDIGEVAVPVKPDSIIKLYLS